MRKSLSLLFQTSGNRRGKDPGAFSSPGARPQEEQKSYRKDNPAGCKAGVILRQNASWVEIIGSLPVMRLSFSCEMESVLG